METATATILFILLIVSTLYSRGFDTSVRHNQHAAICVTLMFVCAVYAPNPLTGIFIAFIGAGMFLVRPASYLCTMVGWQVVAFAGAYVIITPHIQPWMVYGLCMTLLGIGVLLGLWAVYASKIRSLKESFELTLIPKTPWGPAWTIREKNPVIPSCNQGNPNHIHGLATLSTASGVALWWAWGSWLALGLSVVAAAPIATHLWNKAYRWHFGQGWGHLTVLGVTVATLQWGLPAAAIGGSLILGMFITMILWESGTQIRFLFWWNILSEIRTGYGTSRTFSWTVFLFGTGMWTWKQLPLNRKEQPNGVVLAITTAHNEWVQILVEYGPIALGALLWMLWDAASRAWGAGVEGQMLLLLGIPLCSIATVGFPWTFVHSNHKTATHVEIIGSTSLPVVSLVIWIILDGVVR